VVDYQVLYGDPADDAIWEKALKMLKGQYQHAGGELLCVEATFVDSGGAHTQDVYNFTYAQRRNNVYAIKGASKPNRPIISNKPTIVDIDARGRVEKRGGQLWFIGTDTAKDWLTSRWKVESGAGAVHFPNTLDEGYFKQLTSEYRITKFKNGRKISTWEKKAADRNEALDLMVYNLAAAHHLGLHKKSELYWANMRKRLNPENLDLFKQPVTAPAVPREIIVERGATGEERRVDAVQPRQDVSPTADVPRAPVRMGKGRISLSGTKRGGA
jgi:phage terminase large subunit GpA-like protein